MIKLHFVKALFILSCLTFMTGCLSKSVWKYSAEPKIVKSPDVNVSLQIPVFEDERTNSNTTLSKGKLLLAMVPLVPYATILNLKVPEELLPCAPESFTKATGEEIANASFFNNVIIMPDTQKMDADYLLLGTILRTNIQQTISFYGLSLPGGLLWLLDFPTGQVSTELRLRYRVLNKNKELIFDNTYTRKSWWYPSFSSDLGLKFHENSYKGITLEFFADLKPRIINDQLKQYYEAHDLDTKASE